MARRVFFSFHYQRDIFRVNNIRNSWVTQGIEDSGYWDASLWETFKRQGANALKQLIDDGLNNTSVTAVLIGSETYDRRWVRYEIIRSFEKGNGLLGVYINNIPSLRDNTVDYPGPNPFEYLRYQLDTYNRRVLLQEWNGNTWVTYTDIPSINIPNGNSNPYIFQRPNGQLSQIVPIYDWSTQDGYRNFGAWAENAARAFGRR